MTVAIICSALLGFLLFGLGFGVSLTRGKTGVTSGYKTDPTDSLYKMVRAHSNTAEYAPIMVIFMLFLGTRDPAAWVLWLMVIVTASRYLIAAGLIMSESLDKLHPLRLVGAFGTYIGGLLLCLAVLLEAWAMGAGAGGAS